MSAFHQKKIIKSFKDRIRKKLGTVVEETESVTSILAEIVSEFKQKTEQLVEDKSANFFPNYQKLNEELENFREKLFMVQTTICTETTVEDTDDVTPTSDESESCDDSTISGDQSRVCFTKNNGDKLTEASELNLNEPIEKKIDTFSQTSSSISIDCTLNQKLLQPNLAEQQSFNKSVPLDSVNDSHFQTVIPIDNQKSQIVEESFPCANNHQYENEVQETEVSVVNPSLSSLLSNKLTDSQDSSYHSISSSVDARISGFGRDRIEVVDFVEETDYLKLDHISGFFENDAQEQESKLSSPVLVASVGSICDTQKCTEVPEVQDTGHIQPEVQDTGHIHRFIPSPDVPVESNITAILTHFQNPSNFWMQLDGPTIKQFIPSTLPKSLYQNESSLFQVDEYCLAPFKPSGLYNRAKILKFIDPGKTTVEVLYVDYGNTEHIPVSQLQLLPESAFAIPSQAINCYLKGIIPVSGIWSDEAMQKFKEAVEYPLLQIYVFSKNDGIYAVDLTAIVELPDEKIMYNIAQMLCLYNFAVPIDSEQVNVTSGTGEVSLCDISHSSLSDISVYDHQFSSKSSDFVIKDSNCDINHSGTSLIDINDKCDTTFQQLCHSDSDNIQSKSKTKNVFPKKLCDQVEGKSDLFATVKSLKEPISYNLSGSLSDLTDKNGNLCVTQSTEHESLKSNDSKKLTNDIVIIDRSHKIKPQLSSDETLRQKEDKKDHYLTYFMENEFQWNIQVPASKPVFIENDLMLVMLSEIVSPGEFYVNLASENGNEFDDLREQMNTVYESLELTKSLEANFKQLRLNMFCCCRYSVDKNWYRVQILEIYDSVEWKGTSSVLVQYVDYGNKEVVNAKDLRPLMEEFANHPAFAIQCALANIVPIPYKHKDGDSVDVVIPETTVQWDEKSTAQFKLLCSFEDCLTAQVLSTAPCNNNKTSHKVLLWDTDGHDSGDLLINSVLIDKGVAERGPDVLPTEKPCNDALKCYSSEMLNRLSEWDPMGDDFISPLNSYGVDISDAQVAIVGYKANDEKYICKFFAKSGRCFRGDNCPYQHIADGCDEETKDQATVYSLENVPPLPQIESTVLVQISAWFNPSHFYVVFPYGTKPVGEIHVMDPPPEGVGELNILVNAMSEHYDDACYDESCTVALAFGNIVAAKSREDDKWYRARITDVQDITKPVEVFYVDFGNGEWIERKFVRSIKPEFLHLPFQAVECFLANVEPVNKEKGGCWSIKARKTFEELVEGNIFVAYINHQTGSALHLTLHKSTKNGHKITINDYLVKRNLAQFSSPPIEDIESSSSHNQKGKVDTNSLYQPG